MVVDCRLLVVGLRRYLVVGRPGGLRLRLGWGLVGILLRIVVSIKIRSLARVYKSGIYGRRIKRRMRDHRIIFMVLIVFAAVPLRVNLGFLLRPPLGLRRRTV